MFAIAKTVGGKVVVAGSKVAHKVGAKVTEIGVRKCVMIGTVGIGAGAALGTVTYGFVKKYKEEHAKDQMKSLPTNYSFLKEMEAKGTDEAKAMAEMYKEMIAREKEEAVKTNATNNGMTCEKLAADILAIKNKEGEECGTIVVEKSKKKGFKLPKLHMPKISMPKIFKKAVKEVKESAKQAAKEAVQESMQESIKEVHVVFITPETEPAAKIIVSSNSVPPVQAPFVQPELIKPDTTEQAMDKAVTKAMKEEKDINEMVEQLFSPSFDEKETEKIVKSIDNVMVEVVDVLSVMQKELGKSMAAQNATQSTKCSQPKIMVIEDCGEGGEDLCKEFTINTDQQPTHVTGLVTGVTVDSGMTIDPVSEVSGGKKNKRNRK